MLKIYNVLSHKKEEFKPIDPDCVRMYACGLTVSSDAHIGHAYQGVVFDMIAKYLEYKGYKVKYVKNYTDVDDKIINNASKAGRDPIEYANYYVEKTEKEMKQIGNTKPITPRVTENIPQIIDFIKKLIEKDVAYSTENGDVYFKVKSFKDYGKLSRIKLEENEVGVRKELEPGKIDSADFALWKSAKSGEIFWNSPWGKGRPGWHIECSAMNLNILGEQIDIHGGGRDLIFPHHENEIAQTESLTGKKFANFWVHCGLVKINGQKMSKSLGNGITAQEIIEKYDMDTIRLAMFRNLYSSDINVTNDFFNMSALYVYTVYSTLIRLKNPEEVDITKTNKLISGIVEEFEKEMDDNFNTPNALKNLIRSLKDLENEKDVDVKKVSNEILNLFKVFNLFQRDAFDYVSNVRSKVLKENNITELDILEKIKERQKYKEEKSFEKADLIRKELFNKNIILKDSVDGTSWDISL